MNRKTLSHKETKCLVFKYKTVHHFNGFLSPWVLIKDNTSNL